MGKNNSIKFSVTRKQPMFKMNPKKLKEDINILTGNISKLTENKIFFEMLLEEKLKKFIKILKNDIKDSKNKDVVKRCLSLIHKHYEYDPNNPKNKVYKKYKKDLNTIPEKYSEFSHSVSTGLKKIETESVTNEEKFKKEAIKNNNRQRNLLMMMNNKEILQVESSELRKISKMDTERSRIELKNRIKNLTYKNQKLKKIMDSEVYDLTLSHEKKGRDIMQEKVIVLALESVKEGGEELETQQVAQRVEEIYYRVKTRSEWINSSEYDKLMKKKKELEKRIKTAKKILEV